MKRIVILFGLIFFFIGPIQNATANDSLDERYLAAKRYAEITPISAMINDAIMAISKNVSEVKRAEFVTSMKKVINTQKLEKIGIDTMVKHFTVKELNALTEFYSSPVGRSIMKKFGSYMGDIQITMHKEIYQALKQLKHE